MTVEFCGLPGCGKSYLSGVLASVLTRQGLRTEEPSRALSLLPPPLRLAAKLARVAAWALKSPRRAAALWKVLGALNGGLSARPKLFIACALPCSWAGRDAGRVLILDQGSVQALASAAFQNEPERLAALAALLPAPDILVEVKADEEAIAGRLAAGRQGGRSRAEDRAGRAAYASTLAWALARPDGPAARAGLGLSIMNEGSGGGEAALEPLIRSVHAQLN